MSWKKVKLGEVCSIEKGAIGIQKAIPGEFPLVVTGEQRKSHNEYQFDCEAVIVPLVSGTGHGHASIKRIHYQTGKFALGNILCAIIPKNKKELNAEYLFRFLDLNKENELVARMKGMANVTLPIKEIAQIEIPIPPIEEQFEFVENYFSLENQSNELSTELTHQLKLVKKLRQQLLQDAVQGKLSSTMISDDLNDDHDLKQKYGKVWNMSGKELLEHIKAEKEKSEKSGKSKKSAVQTIKADEIPFEIPDGWVWCRLGEVVTQLFDGPFGSHLKSLDYTNSGIQVIRLQNLGVMKFKEEKETFVSQEKYESIIKHTVYEGDIIIGSFLADGVNCVVLPKLKYTAIAKADCFTIRIKHKMLLNTFVMFLLSSSPMFIELSKLLRGMTRLRINTTQLKNLPIPLPPLAEQYTIVQKLDELMRYCDELEASIKESAAQNEKLLQQVLREALRKEEVGKS